MLHITLKSIYMTKKLTPEVILPLLGANRVKSQIVVKRGSVKIRKNWLLGNSLTKIFLLLMTWILKRSKFSLVNTTFPQTDWILFNKKRELCLIVNCNNFVNFLHKSINRRQKYLCFKENFYSNFLSFSFSQLIHLVKCCPVWQSLLVWVQ